ncbi:MAG: amino acid adenylation domain-containing protein, partial [Phycisphaerae bacterium]|nr:amino acid adenylation domain-containing protein [Phycisphaerae bacterium]
RLLIVIHHLAVDGVSWRILLEDLFTAYGQLEAQRPVELPAKTTSFREWAQRLIEHARSDAMEAESRYWLGLAEGAADMLPLDREACPNDMASVETVRVTLDTDETHELLHEVSAAYRTRIDEVLLTAVVQAFGEWTGCAALWLDIEGHGREDLFDDVDLARTVGWFTTMFPVRFDLSDAAGPGEAIKHVKQRWRDIPRHGIGFGLLRYLRGDAELAQRLATIRPQVRFNYLGQLDAGMQGSMPLAIAPESFGPLSGSRNTRTHLLDINAGVTAGRLEVAWTYSRNRHTVATINRLAGAFVDALRTLIAHCRRPDVGGCTPSDFPLAALDQAALDQLVGNGRAIEDLYPLSPLQAGLLFHSRYAPDSAVYFSQFSCTLVGDFDPDAYRAAWQRIIDRHPVLRTSFTWKRLNEPLQLVHRHVPVAWTQHDWRDVPAAEQPARIDAFLEADRQRGFDLDKPPLTRLAVLRLADDAWHIVSTNHHLLLDGWSLPIMMTEVMATYEGLVRGQEVPLDPPRPYRDYIRWLREQDLAEAEAFWRRMLKGFAAPTPLPAARSAGAVEAGAMASYNGQLSEAATATLEQWARRHQVTLNTLVQGAWAILLSRYSGESDIAFGMTVSGRSVPLAGIETTPGVFINTLPVRVAVSADVALLPWLHALQSQQADLRQFEHSPLAQVQRWSDVPAGLPLFESIIVFENYPVDQALRQRGASLAIRDVRRHLARTNYPLVLVVEPGKSLRFEIAYDTGRFDAATIERLFGHLRTLLEAMTADGEPCVASLPMLTPPEYQQLIDEWGRTAAAVTASHDRVADANRACIHRRFEAQAARRPDAVAVTCDGERLSYRQLNEWANRLAHYLVSAGVGPETLVGICLERSLDMVVAILGVIKAGGAYVPLDPSYPADRLQFMVADARMPVVVTVASLAERLSAPGARCVCLDTEAVAIAACVKVDPPSAVAPDNAAYVIYTSGSTGKPKGVVVTHCNVTRLFDATEAWFGFGADDVWTLFHSYAFDFSVWELWGALCYGGRLVVVPFAVSRSPEAFAALLRAEGVTVLNQTPSAFASLLRISDALPAPAESALRFVIFGGEALDLQMLRPWFDRYGDARPRMINMYGITETTVHVTYRPITRADLDAASGSMIGRPIPDLRTYILDAHGQPAPVGVPGELHVGGAGLARGYLNRPDLTTERFIPNPFLRRDGERLYKTGDLCCYRPDGDVEYLGRIDDQVKIRGFRVELGEIETALEEHPNVHEAVVLARATDTGEKRLVGYVVAGDDIPAISDLRLRLAGCLPDYMVPSAFVFLDAIPRLPNGKIDRKALPAPDAVRPELTVGYVAPRNDLERCLAQVWSAVLGVERVGVMDDFFELGGDSIVAARLVYQLEEHLGEAVYPVALFESPNIAELAQSLATAYPDTITARFGTDAVPVASEVASPGLPGFMALADLAVEAVLDPAIRPEAAARDGGPATVLLTGATGFLGAFLLAEWLEQTTAEVHCLVRAADDDTAAARIERTLESYGIWNDAFRSRIVPVAGDLSKPLLGLSADRFDALAETLDVIVHNGALVNFLQPYAALKTPNVLGTQEVLRLACRHHAKPVHYVSTSSVFATQELAGCVVYEADSPDNIAGLRGGYAQSKWVAEKLVTIAEARGLPVAIYRPGRISGHSRTGASNTDDMMLQLLLGCIRIGAAPDLDMEDDMAPVDYIARAIVHFACRSNSCGKAFHLVNPHPVRWVDLLEGLGACGYPVACVSLERWLDAWGDGQAPEHRAFQRMARAFVGADLPRLPRFDCRNTLDGLRGTTLSCPPVDAALLKTYLAYWTRAGLLEPPTVSA